MTEAIFENSIIQKPSLGSREVPQKIWARSVQLLGRLLDTNKQTEKQNIYIDVRIKETEHSNHQIPLSLQLMV